MIDVTIDGKKIEVEPGRTILQAAKELNIKIPTLCHHPLIEPYAACRICVVEIERGRRAGLQTSCNYQIEEPISVLTASDRVLDARRMILELMLARCPEVPVLRELADELGVDYSGFAPTGEKCILCGLCVRACEQIVGVSAISFANRGTDRVVTTPFDELSEVCITCGACAYFCPTGAVTMEDIRKRAVIHREMSLGPTTAIRVPFLQAVPNVPFIDSDACIHFKTGECGICSEVCEPGAINYDLEDSIEEIEVGSVVLTTGYQIFDCSKIPHLGYNRLPNVVNSLEFEHLCHASGPTGGKIKMEDGQQPSSIGIVHCVGSRDENYNKYCSRACCMYALKFAHLAREKVPDAEIYEFYIDMRANGKGYEEFYSRILEEGVNIIRGKVAEVSDVALTPEEEGKLVVRCEDTLVGVVRRIPVDMVVLCPAMVPQPDADEMARKFGLCVSPDGFIKEQHPKLGPINTDAEGVFVAGTAQFPKDIPDTVAQGAGAAGAVMSLGEELDLEPIKGFIDEELCSGCKICVGVCPYDAISYDKVEKISRVEEMTCKGCGLCAAVCPSGAASQQNFLDEQIFAEIEGALIQVED